MLFKKSVLFLFIVTLSFQLRAQTADDVIKKYIAFTGGVENWQKVQTIFTSGTYNYNGIEFPFKAYSKAPNQYKFIVPFQGKYFAQAFDGQNGWKIDAFKGETNKTILSGKDAKAMINEADVELESPFINYLQKGHKLLLQGIDTVAGTICYNVKLIRSNGNMEIYYFKQANFELLKKQAYSKNSELEGSLMDTYYKDYRTVEGISVAFIQENKVNNQAVLTVTIEKLILNEPISESEFKP